MHSNFRLVVAGASAGGLPVLELLAAGLPADLPAAVFVVIHVPERAVSYLDEILDRAGPLPAHLADDGEEIRPGHIYCARPGHHLLIEGNRVAVKSGPKENRFRPSIDALFRSAAYTGRERTIGVVLSGTMSDGTSGLWTIKRFGGITIVQDPSEAAYDAMPLNALVQVDIDHRLPAAEIGPLIGRLAKSRSGRAVHPSEDTVERVKKEIRAAASDDAFDRGLMQHGALTQFTCPECHGALVEIEEGSLARYRCHTGHAFTPSALLDGIAETVGTSLWNALRAMQEAVMLLDRMATRLAEIGAVEEAARFRRKAEQTRRKSRALQERVISAEHDLSEINPEKAA